MCYRTSTPTYFVVELIQRASNKKCHLINCEIPWWLRKYDKTFIVKYISLLVFVGNFLIIIQT